MEWKTCRQDCHEHIFVSKVQKHTNDSIKKEHLLKKTNKEGAIISVRNIFLPIFRIWFSILNNLLIANSLTSVMKDFASHFFSMFAFYTP